jgi:NifU-like protein involved in Fe-S cluster formation
MEGVSQFSLLMKCDNLSWQALKAALELPKGSQSDGFVSNEVES